MSCYRPIKGFLTPTGVVFNELSRYDIRGRVDLPCGKCIGCRMRHAQDWKLRVLHEASLQDWNCFITLTYAPGQMPVNASLDHRDFQLFMKRLRKFMDPFRVRFYMCGEYGDEKGRPHYHAAIFGHDFRSDRVECGKSGAGEIMYESATLEELWGKGKCTVQDLTASSAGYVAQYIMKKQLGPESEGAYDVELEDGTVYKRAAPYSAMSLKPGIGAEWFEKFHGDVFPEDFVVADGKKHSTPKYYDRLLKRRDADKHEDVMQERGKRARAYHEDNTDERLAVREHVHLAKVRNLKRGLE